MAKYDGYPLRLIGVDTTNKNVKIPAPQVGVGPSFAPELMQQSSQRLLGAANSLAQGAQLSANISQQILENQVSASNSALQTSLALANVAGQKLKARSEAIGQVSQFIMQNWEFDQKRRAQQQELEYRKQREAIEDYRESVRLSLSIAEHQNRERQGKLQEYYQQNEQVAIVEFSALENDAPGIIHNYGNQELVDRLSATVQKYRGKVSTQFIDEWTRRINNAAGTERDRQFNVKYENVRQIQNAARTMTLQTFELENVNIASNIAAGNITVDQGISQLISNANRYIQENNLDPLTSLEVQNRALKLLLDSGKLSFDQAARVQAYQRNLQIAHSKVREMLEEGTVRDISPEERTYRLAAISKETGIELGILEKLAPTPADLVRRAQESVQLAEQVSELQRKQFVSEANKLSFNNAVVGDFLGTLIERYHGQPNQIEAFLNHPNLQGIEVIERAKAVWKDYKEYIEIRQRAQKVRLELIEKKARLRAEIKKLQAQGRSESEIQEFLRQYFAQQSLESLPEEIRPLVSAANARILDVKGLTQIYEALDEEYDHLILQQITEFQKAQRSMAAYGLDDVFGLDNKGVSSLTRLRQKHQKDIQRYKQQYQQVQDRVAQQSVIGGTSSPFESGGSRIKPVPSRLGLTETSDGVNHTPIKAASQLVTTKYKNLDIALPFRPNSKVTITDDYGGPGTDVYKRRGRSHAGIDISAPPGTPVVTPVAGKVIRSSTQLDPKTGRGYGRYIDIQIPDGRVLRFAHLGNTFVREGEILQPGQLIAKVGDSGSPGSHHLHFEVRSSDPDKQFYFEGSEDPKQFLAEVKRGYVTARPRRQNSLVHSYNPLSATPTPPNSALQPPANSVLLPNNQFIQNGQIFSPTPQLRPNTSNTNFDTLPFRAFVYKEDANRVFNRASPLPEMHTPSAVENVNLKESNVKDNTFGYKVLAKNPRWANAIVNFANWLGVPAVWIADVLYFESGLNPNAVNQFGCVGIAQFCGAQRDEFGGLQKITSMGFEGQLELLKRYFTKWGLRGQIRTIEELYTAFQRPAYVKRLQRGDYSVLNMKDGNGKSIKFYIENYIGKTAGRKYKVNSPAGRAQRAINTTHNTYVAECKLCNQLLASNSPLIPHKLEIA